MVGGGHFAFQFNEAGTYPYHCTIHPSIVGEIDVRRVILGPLPTAAVPVGAHVDFTGRTADPTQPAAIQRSPNGSAFTTIASATPAPDGTWKATVSVDATGDYRAAAGGGTSQTRRLLVGIRRVRIRVSEGEVSIRRPARVRVVLVAKDGWTPIATSPVVVLRPA